MLHLFAFIFGCFAALCIASGIMLNVPPGVNRAKLMMTYALSLLGLSIVGAYFWPATIAPFITFSFTILLFWNIMRLKNFLHLKAK